MNVIVRLRALCAKLAVPLAAFHAAEAARSSAGIATPQLAWRRPEAERPEQPDELPTFDVSPATIIAPAAAPRDQTIYPESLRVPLTIPNPTVTLSNAA